MIEKDTKRYTYDLLHNGAVENFPLQLGSGSYKISILQNITGTSYRYITSQTFDVTIADPNTTYLNSIQNINWNIDSKAIAKAVDLTKGTTDLKKKATLLWTYMAKNNKYDYNKLATLNTSYVPTIDKTLLDKTGICYDFSSLYAAMLRSQGIPAKLVKGYAPKNASGYHAWNEVYDKATSKWVVIDSTYDLQVIAKYPKLAQMIKPTANYQKIYEY
jgi:transglutaminase-like putative cysteine protease